MAQHAEVQAEAVCVPRAEELAGTELVEQRGRTAKEGCYEERVHEERRSCFDQGGKLLLEKFQLCHCISLHVLDRVELQVPLLKLLLGEPAKLLRLSLKTWVGCLVRSHLVGTPRLHRLDGLLLA